MRLLGKSLFPTKAEPDYPVMGLQREMNRLLDDWFHDFDIEPFAFTHTGNGGRWMPKVDVSETENEVVVAAELPGMEEKDIEVSLHGNSLILEGEKKAEEEEKREDYYRKERVYGSFQRIIPLPAEVEMAKVDAKFSKGVLTVTLPKTQQAKKATRKIPVHGE